MNSHPPFFANAQVMALDPAHIMVPERIGFLHQDKAAALGRLMAVDGQRDPIKVVRNLPSKPVDTVLAEGKKPWRLVTGMHRLEGAKLEGITVYALEVVGKPEDFADLEASENLHRRPLGPIERAKFTAALVQAAQERIAREHGELSQHKLAVKARWDKVKHGETRASEALTEEVGDTCAKFAHVYGWEESVGEALGMSRRSIHNDLQLFRMLIEPFPEHAEALANHPVVGENASQLRLIAQVQDEKHRRRVIEVLLADREIGAEDALVLAKLARPKAPPPPKDVKFTNTISDSWSRLSLNAQRAYLPRFVGLLTDGQRAQLRALLDGETGE